jgi:uncharacterized protein (TIGR02687 family)
MSKVEQNLIKLFEKHRIVLWYDAENSFSDQFEDLSLKGIEKLRVENNEFQLKHHVLVEKPTSNFLVYKSGERPENDENWLLDLELANHIFETDQVGLTLQELDLPYAYRNWVERHLAFFLNKKRLSSFTAKLSLGLTEDQLSYLLLQLIVKSNSSMLDDILRMAAQLFIQDKWEAVHEDLKKYGIDSFLWEALEANYNYKSDTPSLYDFLLEIYQKSFAPTSTKSALSSGAEVLMANWKDARSFEEVFIKLSSKVEKDLNIKTVVKDVELDSLLNEDLFESVEQQIIIQIVSELCHEAPAWDRVEKSIKTREHSYWTNHKYSDFYKSLFYASEFLQFIKNHKHATLDSFDEGLVEYTTEGYKADQYYRLFIDHYRMTKQNKVLNGLYNTIHKAYSNTWLVNQSSKWQSAIEKSQSWYDGLKKQRNFFKNWVKREFIDKDKKVFVVISDALRFENGEELHQRFVEENRFTSQLDYQVSGLPSYTQLGMASLLPHDELALDSGDLILADGKSTAGAANRKKILEEKSGVRATVIGAEELMKLNSKSDKAKDLVKGHDLIYIYHNRIDKVGDDKTSEDKVIEAAREEINFLVDVAKKISNMNGTHILFTSDHGYIYQHEVLEKSDFADAEISGKTTKENRRFVIGEKLKHNNTVVKYAASDVGLNNELEVLIPKGINRLRKQGAGSRFVHGGASLQEVVVPIVWASKKKADTVEKVTIDVLNKSSNRITTNSHTVRFYQTDPIGNGIIARQVKAYLAIEKNDELTSISDIFNYRFDSESQKTEEREVIQHFKLSTSVMTSQSVYLIISEQVEGTNKWNVISKYPYSLTLAMENDFDDF